MTLNDMTIRLAMHRERNRLLNTWLREFRPDLLQTIRVGHEVEIAAGDVVITAKCEHFSPAGFHRFGERVTVNDQSGLRVIEDASELTAILLKTQRGASSEDIEDILYRIGRSSLASREHAIFLSTAKAGISAVALEQSLWFGHPFHPLAKSVGGFTKADTEKYAPERATRFQLRWLLVKRRHVAEFESDRQRLAPMDLRLRAASGLSASDMRDDILFPCHPWQAARLEGNPDFADRIRSGEIRITQATGDAAAPTSSVRTVWFSDQNLFVKLPIEARITNFPRVNTDEQIARSVAGARAIAAVGPAVARAGLTVLDEPVGRIVQSCKAGGGFRYHPETGYLLRDADFGKGPSPLVVAGLLEANPANGKPNLAEVSGHYLQDRESTHRWLTAYMRISLIPLLRLFSDTGIALEAHSQNSLVRFVDGWPDHLFIRDLEGIAVDRSAFERRFSGEDAALLDHALFYDRKTVWRRFLYYVVVNHFSHVVATAAEVSGIDESDLWGKARRVLEEVSDLAAIGELLASSQLPAKANLLSCLGGYADTPSYVPVPNPLLTGKTTAPSDIRHTIFEEATP
ncbi:IucA/IucC family protein [Agrobacterium salinitolerans]